MSINKIAPISLIIISTMILTACASPFLSASAATGISTQQSAQATEVPQTGNSSTTNQTTSSSASSASLSAYESVLESIYTRVNPSVVNITVTETSTASSNSSNVPGFQFFFGSPNNQNQPQAPQISQALGSGFVWDSQGHIVTNNHVVANATSVEVKFSDGTILPAKVVGTDVSSDLAVIQVDASKRSLVAVPLSDSSQVKVGQAAIAIGNPYGLENTMTVGIVSAVGRSLPSDQVSTGGSYSIPDIIQTDAPINPGNSGGVLVNDNGELIGVTSAIESSTNSNAGIGFAIPANIVNKVIPALIKDGKYEHSYLGISGTTLTPDLAKAMNIDTSLRGILVIEVTAGGPAAKGGLVGSSKTVTINGQDTQVGGDIITKVDGQATTSMDDIIAYLSDQTTVGQKVSLTILRGNAEKTIDVTLEARPASTSTPTSTNGQTQPRNPSGVWLGVAVQAMTPEIAAQMNLSNTQSGLLIEEVQTGSPADTAGLQGSYKPVLINGKRVMVGGDIILSVDGKTVTTSAELSSVISGMSSGQEVILSILRDGKQQDVKVTLADRPAQ
jgi:serine protease Do